MTENTSQSEYNRRFLDRLKVRRPDLLDLANTVTHEDVEYIKIEIAPPEGQHDIIVISTYGPELTMFFHDHHAHFDMFDGGDEQEEFDEFFDYIESFMNEELISVSEYDGDRWCSSHDASADEPIESKKDRQIIVRSWKGTYSRTIA